MINPKEIKIDNIVYIPETKQIAKITAIHKHLGVGVNNSFVAIPFEKIEPIKISKEILLTCKDLVLCEGKYGEYFKHKELDGFRIWFHENKRTSVWWIGIKNISSECGVDLRNYTNYVHILQNIFSVDCGYEFELKFNFY